MIVEGENLYGDGVNVAARLEALSQIGGVCLSKSIMDFVNKKTEFLFNDLGEQKVKNTIVHAFDLNNPDLEKRSNIDETVTAAASAKIKEGSVPPTHCCFTFYKFKCRSGTRVFCGWDNGRYNFLFCKIKDISNSFIKFSNEI